MSGIKKIAVVADIHGNTAALESVLADIASREVDAVLNLGDSLYGPLDPSGTFELIVQHDMISISGNEDRMIIENSGGDMDNPTLRYVRGQLGREAFTWLSVLPFDMVHDGMFYCCHGTPRSDTEYLVEELKPDHVDVRGPETLHDILKKVSVKIVLCAHSHVPRLMDTGDRVIINPGSVGLQAYDDDHPVFHLMENHDPYAKYSMLSLSGGNLRWVEQISIPYDAEWAAEKAERNGRPDWAKWLRTGRG
jgi:predicted phosphodiesterase